MPQPRIDVPAAYVPPNALAYGALGEAAVMVTPASPLPVYLSAQPGGSPLIGTASVSGRIGPFAPQPDRPVMLTLSGSWSGEVRLLRSAGGADPLPATLAGAAIMWSANVNEIVWVEGEAGAALYLDLVVASGTLTYRVAQ